VLIFSTAIEYIRQTQHTERQLHAEVTRLQRDSEYHREAHKENDMLKTEVQVMHQHLRRLDPQASHVYGHFTSQLNQQQQQQQQQQPPPAPSSSHQPQANGGAGMALPPLNAGPGSSQGGPPPPAPMQGVEYGFAR
jgi:hypothetical protein